MSLLFREQVLPNYSLVSPYRDKDVPPTSGAGAPELQSRFLFIGTRMSLLLREQVLPTYSFLSPYRDKDVPPTR